MQPAVLSFFAHKTFRFVKSTQIPALHLLISCDSLAGISANAIHERLEPRVFGIGAALVGTVLAIVAPVGDFEEFLYLIGSIFAPMAALVITDYFLLHRDVSAKAVDWRNVVLWACGFILYRFSLSWDIPCGNTFPVMVAIALAAVAVDKIAAVVRKEA